ncbi:MAG: lipoprotein-releasing ABC transporter permease subunit [Betaproteobacteria bacterium]|nr:MAG: lipoprotein-releasing ABC transporter permease subunit [Betaproteobacteria bacterium]TMI12409.1 MAG: lipoprotein-releasing ABC transporter permease subunit [Betaproteobacteria bacterium]TMI35062.1 MAG: lipoprotein-releasing ABC transporter permease subunit [Betaproteobacteria bacterium]
MVRYELLVGLRYTRAKRRNRFIGINSLVSMIGIFVGVWALIVVLSVMNGFQKEVRTRILGVASHVQISSIDNRLPDWRSVAALAAQHPRVRATAPFVQAQAMLAAGQAVRGAVVRGILPEEEEKVADIGQHMRSGSLADLRPGEFGVVLGADLARGLGVLPGDKLALVAPQGLVTPAGVIPRLKQFTVVGSFEVGMADADAGLALVHLRDAQTLYQLGDAVSGVRLRLDDLFAARSVARELMTRLPQNVFASDWTRSHANFFRAVEIEKRMMFIILTLIILVAAINIISTLVVAVTDKQADIAILRTLGAAPGSVMQIFIVQGMVIGIAGTLIGAGLGIVTALNIDVIVPAIESAFNIKFLSKDVYLIPELPSDLQAGDVGAIVLMALGLSFFATLYPSWRAARVNPAEALRYE